jgi:hypothetical protein
LAVSVVLLGLLFSRVQTRDFGRALAGLSLSGLAVYAAASLVSSWLRAWRYKWLLAPAKISWRNILLVTFIRNSFDDLLPARIGSLSYIYVLNKRLGYSFESAASSFVVAFVFDFMTLYPFVMAALLAAGLGQTSIPRSTLLAAAVFFFALFVVILWKLVPISKGVLRALGAVLRAFRQSEKPKVQTALTKLGTTVECLDGIRHRGIYGRLFLISMVIRLGKYVSLFALFYALLHHRGFALSDLSVWKTILGITGAEMTSALPIKGLADFGTWESAWVVSLRLMGFDPKLAILSGFGIHLLTSLFEYSLGLASLLILLLPYLARRKP